MRGPGWVIGPGSALSLNDPNMFVLVFQHLATGMEEIRWVAPQEMSDRITELIKAAISPEGQAGLKTLSRLEMIALTSRLLAFALERRKEIVRGPNLYQ